MSNPLFLWGVSEQLQRLCTMVPHDVATSNIPNMGVSAESSAPVKAVFANIGYCKSSFDLFRIYRYFIEK